MVGSSSVEAFVALLEAVFTELVLVFLEAGLTEGNVWFGVTLD